MELSKPDRDNGVITGQSGDIPSVRLFFNDRISTFITLWYDADIHAFFQCIWRVVPRAPGDLGYLDSCAFDSPMADAMSGIITRYGSKMPRVRNISGRNGGRPISGMDALRSKAKPDMIDTVAYIVFGPVYDDPAHTNNGRTPSGKNPRRLVGRPSNLSNEPCCSTSSTMQGIIQTTEAYRYLETPGKIACLPPSAT